MVLTLIPCAYNLTSTACGSWNLIISKETELLAEYSNTNNNKKCCGKQQLVSLVLENCRGGRLVNQFNDGSVYIYSYFFKCIDQAVAINHV